MLLGRLIYFLPLIQACKQTYKNLVELIKTKEDYLTIDTNQKFAIHEVHIEEGVIFISRLTVEMGWEPSGRIFKIKFKNLESENLKDLIDTIVKTLYSYQEYRPLKILRIQNNYPGNIINTKLTNLLLNINKFEIYKNGNIINFKYDQVMTHNYLRDLLIESPVYLAGIKYPKEDGIILINENGKLYINFFILVRSKFLIYKLDVQELISEKVLDIYTVTEILIRLRKSIFVDLKRTNNSLEIRSMRNFNINNENRNFKIEFIDKMVKFSNLNQTFIYSNNESLKIKDKKSNCQRISGYTYKDFKDIFALLKKAHAEKYDFTGLFYELLKRENLIRRIVYRILRNSESANFIIFIHVLGNLGLLDLSQIIYFTRYKSKSESVAHSEFFKYIFDKKFIDKIINLIIESEKYDLKHVLTKIFFFESEKLFWEEEKLEIFDKFRNLNKDDDLYTIHKKIFSSEISYLDRASKNILNILESTSLVTDLNFVSYRIYNNKYKVNRKDIEKKIEEIGLEEPNELKNFLYQIEN